jgi:glycosyltransferase involved in cell wall biosynthesis
MRFHVLGIPHTITTPEYSTCAFTQKVVKLCTMLRMRGHHVTHYGNEASVVECDEHVTVTTLDDLAKSYPGHDWRIKGWPMYQFNDEAYRAFYANTISALVQRKQPGDFLCLTFGAGHKPIMDAVSGLINVESGIGYPDGGCAPFRVFESAAIMHAYQGVEAIKFASNNKWYDVVIPNSFNLNEFKFSAKKRDFFLFLGRVNEGKGIHIARQIAETTRTKLVVAGGHSPKLKNTKLVKYTGVVSPDKRRVLLSNAKAILCPSTFMEPFCGVQIEAMLSGTPVISSNWGAFTEYNLHGETGYRCNTFEQFAWAAKHISDIHPVECRAQGEKFSNENVSWMYDEYFHSLKNIEQHNDWYGKTPKRTSLQYVARD